MTITPQYMNDKPDHDDEDQKIVKQILIDYSICDFCIGRIVHWFDSTNQYIKYGEKYRETYTEGKKILSSSCELCDGILDEIDYITDLILNAIKDYEFSSFILGFHIDPEILEKEHVIFSFIPKQENEPLKNFLKKSIGSRIEKELNKTVSFDDAEIMIIVNTMFHTVDLQIKPLYIYGRYNKFKRGVPQTKWFCKQCSGIGCRACQYTGSIYDSSIEEFIAKSFLAKTGGDDWSFHGSGREDIDVKMLGSGRPFIIEIINPKKRTINLTKIQDDINTKYDNIITISNLRFTIKNDIARIKESTFQKVYEITFEAEKPFDTEKLKKVALALRGTIIQQFTPTRVAHRRAKKIRERKIYNCSVVSVKDNKARFIIESASGTYIKELVTGDNGRTKPNISELIGQPCDVLTLDVLEIKGE